MTTFLVSVLNERTGDLRVLSIEHSNPYDATTDGALAAFYQLGWRSVTAMPAREIGTVSPTVMAGERMPAGAESSSGR